MSPFHRPEIDLNYQSIRTGSSALTEVVRTGYLYNVQLLLEGGRADVDLRQNNGNTALHVACYFGHLGIVMELVSKGQANVYLRNNKNLTAMDYAVMRNHQPIVDYLKDRFVFIFN